jgi:hypothetical protein
MAPEQFTGHWRTFGPWTDLYALGCLAWHLLCGFPPYAQATRLELLAQAHLTWPPPLLRPAFAVPPGADAWIQRLMAKRPEQRFQRAADASWALRRLGEADPGTVSPSHPVVVPSALFETTVVDSIPVAPILDVAPARAPMTVQIPPMPASWMDKPTDQALIREAGLSLFGLRTIPLSGRHMERSVMWRALASVRETSAVQVVVLEGPGGTGKSRLARWLCVQAHSCGAADYRTVVHSPNGGQSDGLLPMIRHALGCHGLSVEDARE